jgi:molybdopterin-binding protein
MNKIPVTIEKIDTHEQLRIVSFRSRNEQLKMMSLELDKEIQERSQVILTTKATNIAIAKECNCMLSYSNQLPVKIDSLEMGELLCSLKLTFEDTILESIITADSAKRMDLKSGDSLTALIKASDLSIEEVIA